MSSQTSPTVAWEIRDPFFWLGLLSTSVPLGTLASGSELRFLPLVSQLILVTAALRVLSQAPPAFESAGNRQAWQGLTLALRALWLESAWRLFPTGLLPATTWATTGRELLHAAFYGLVVFAVERRLAASKGSEGSALASDWAQRVVLMSVGLVAYFVVVPRLHSPPEPAAPVLFALCALYLVVRIAERVRHAAKRRQLEGSPVGPRLGFAFVALLVAELLEPAGEPVPMALADVGAHLFLVLTILVGRGRHHGCFLPEREGGKTTGWPPIGPGQITLLYAFALPLLHLGWEAGASRGWLLPGGAKALREAFLAVWLALVGALATFQHRRFHGQLLAIGRQRARAENALRKSQASLALMVERQRNQRAVQEAELNFATIFRASPRGLLICSFPDLEILDANDRFSRLCGQPVDELRGRHLLDLGLRPHSSQIQSLSQTQRLEGLEQNLRLPDGETIAVRTSLELLGTKSASAVLVVVRRAHDALAPTGRGAPEAVLRHPALALAACTHQGFVYLWTPGAETRFGVSAAEAVGQDVSRLVDRRTPEIAVRALIPGGPAEGRNHGFLLVARPDPAPRRQP